MILNLLFYFILFYIIKDVIEKKLFNRRFFLPYGTRYNDEYQSYLNTASHHHDIYGRMYSDLSSNIGILFWVKYFQNNI